MIYNMSLSKQYQLLAAQAGGVCSADMHFIDGIHRPRFLGVL